MTGNTKFCTLCHISDACGFHIGMCCIGWVMLWYIRANWMRIGKLQYIVIVIVSLIVCMRMLCLWVLKLKISWDLTVDCRWTITKHLHCTVTQHITRFSGMLPALFKSEVCAITRFYNHCYTHHVWKNVFDIKKQHNHKYIHHCGVTKFSGNERIFCKHCVCCAVNVWLKHLHYNQN